MDNSLYLADIHRLSPRGLLGLCHYEWLYKFIFLLFTAMLHFTFLRFKTGRIVGQTAWHLTVNKQGNRDYKKENNKKQYKWSQIHSW